MNLLNFIECIDLNIKEQPVAFQYINLHTRNKQKAINQGKKFFANYHFLEFEDETKNIYNFYTKTSEYLYYGGYEYKLSKGKDGIFWLILQNENNFYD